MPQSFAQLYAHLIFSTKNRRPFLDDEIRPRVHGYLATVIRNLDSPFVVVGGVADHVHILFDMGKMHAPVQFVEQVKRESSKFVKTLGAKYKEFYWQRGTGCSPSARRIARTCGNRKSTIARSRSRRSFESSSSVTG